MTSLILAIVVGNAVIGVIFACDVVCSMLRRRWLEPRKTFYLAIATSTLLTLATLIFTAIEFYAIGLDPLYGALGTLVVGLFWGWMSVYG